MLSLHLSDSSVGHISFEFRRHTIVLPWSLRFTESSAVNVAAIPPYSATSSLVALSVLSRRNGSSRYMLRLAGGLLLGVSQVRICKSPVFKTAGHIIDCDEQTWGKRKLINKYTKMDCGCGRLNLRQVLTPTVVIICFMAL